MQLDKVEGISIDDVRHEQCSLDTNGFFLLPLQTKMTAGDFEERAKVTKLFLPQLAHAVKSTLGAGRVQIFDYAVWCLEISTHLLPRLTSSSSERDTATFPSATAESMNTSSPLAWPTLVSSDQPETVGRTINMTTQMQPQATWSVSRES